MNDPQDAYRRRMEANKRWNNKAYRQRCIRFHRGSDLDDRLGRFCAEGGSVNYLISDLLSHYFGVANPYKEKHTRVVEQIYP